MASGLISDAFMVHSPDLEDDSIVDVGVVLSSQVGSTDNAAGRSSPSGF